MSAGSFFRSSSTICQCTPCGAAVARYDGNRYKKSFSCLDQYLCMAFAQLTFRESLRDIEACLRAHKDKLYHMGIRGGVSRSTLADANERRNWRIYADLAHALIGVNKMLILAYPLLMVVGFSMVLTAAGSNTLLQHWARDDVRGRVMSAFTFSFLGIAPLGSLAAGSLAQEIGIRPTFVLFGSALVVGGHCPQPQAEEAAHGNPSGYG
jgi:hypothetical protein